MQIQKKIVIFQIVINILFLLLTINLVIGSIIEGKLYRYLSLGFFITLMLLSVLLFKRSSDEQITVEKRYATVLKYNVYAFLIIFVTTTFVIEEDLFSPKGIVFISLLFVTSIFGIIYNLVTFLKSN